MKGTIPFRFLYAFLVVQGCLDLLYNQQYLNRNGKQRMHLEFIWQLTQKVQEWTLFDVCQAVSRRYLTADARVQFQSSSRTIYGGQSGTRTGICPSAVVFPPALLRHYAIVMYPSPT